MKLVIDEKLKHRLIGVAVIISLAAIFAPAMMKKSNQNMSNSYNVSVKLPPKPAEPDVAVSDEKEVFKTIKIARVKVAEVSEDSQLPNLAKAEVLHHESIASEDVSELQQPLEVNRDDSIQLALNNAAKNTVKKASEITLNEPVPVEKPKVAVSKKVTKPAVKIAAVAAKKSGSVAAAKKQVTKVASNRTAPHRPVIREDVYAVQLASFAKLANAQLLVNRLHSKGYKASYTRVASRSGVTYKVYAGHSPRKSEVMKTRTQLASGMQLNGFIVSTKVS